MLSDLVARTTWEEPYPCVITQEDAFDYVGFYNPENMFTPTEDESVLDETHIKTLLGKLNIPDNGVGYIVQNTEYIFSQGEILFVLSRFPKAFENTYQIDTSTTLQILIALQKCGMVLDDYENLAWMMLFMEHDIIDEITDSVKFFRSNQIHFDEVAKTGSNLKEIVKDLDKDIVLSLIR